MSLLQQIQDAAVDSTCDLGTVLRKCKVLAARLGNNELEQWLLWESNGYPDISAVPDYRIWSLELKGHFSGPFGSGLRNAPIPHMCVPKNVRDQYQRYHCRRSVASIEAIVRASDKKGHLQVSTGDLAVALGQNVYQNQNCVQAWAEFSSSNLVELLNSVRNRALDFALAVWKEDPSAGDINTKQHIAPSRVTQIFNTSIYGGAANLVGEANHSQFSIVVQAKDRETLDAALRKGGVVDEDLGELHTALALEPNAAATDKFGPKVSLWISKMVGKAATGAWGISIGAAANLLSDAIGRYYGLK